MHMADFPLAVIAQKDRAYLGAVSRQMTSRPIDLAGRANALQTASLLRRCRLLVSVDTGLMHLGAAVGLPVVALYGDGPPLWHPWGEGHQVLTRPLRRREGGDEEPLSVEGVVEAARLILGPPVREVSSVPAKKEPSRRDEVQEERW
jgi:ADP-heptose:LPS heptosyltransferase